MSLSRIVIATTNSDKLREIEQILTDLPLELVPLSAYPGVSPAPEDQETFEANARQKALHYAAATGEVVVAEDSGFEIDRLDRAPGVRSARHPGRDYAERMATLYAELEARGPRESRARFVCAVALASSGAVLFETRCTVEGAVAPEPRGTGGFGYDPMFLYPPYGRTLAEVSQDEKAAVSHRGQAFRQLRAWLARATL
ncbi:MAG: RdgB/HAM1 family non-canonical purine NTP pyrophosphatase [Luteitalea sp.]|nr:RdgB/HAM1 family non-canonical purine NTP pyrophosphatase [Luteitalea sp.]